MSGKKDTTHINLAGVSSVGSVSRKRKAAKAVKVARSTSDLREGRQKKGSRVRRSGR